MTTDTLGIVVCDQQLLLCEKQKFQHNFWQQKLCQVGTTTFCNPARARRLESNLKKTSPSQTD